MNNLILSRLKSVQSAYLADRDRLIADLNLLLSQQHFTVEENLTERIKFIIQQLAISNLCILETKDIWDRMNNIEQLKEEDK